jgi:ribosomal subunit interface protein
VWVRSRPMAGDHSRRRVWGQRPGQPDASPPSLAFRLCSWRMDRPMDLRLQTRGGRIGDRLRQVAAHKLSGLERMEPALVRVEIEVISQKNSQRVEAVAATARKTYRAHADAREVESALDVVVDKLERQVRDHHQKRRARLIAGAGRVISARSIGEGRDRATPARDGDETS